MPHKNSPMSPPPPHNHVHIGGRALKLAVRQLEIVRDYILRHFPLITCLITAYLTLGDKVQTQPLYLFGGKALWTKELETLLLEPLDDNAQLDLIVHSLKDMPTNLPDEFELGCILDREDPSDALVMRLGSPYKTLAELPAGSLVGTSSVRRLAQLMKNHPHLRFDSVRGNLNTRLRKLDAADSPFECLLLASAGLQRIGLGHRITAPLQAPEMYYAVGQGALGIEIRKNDFRMLEILRKIENIPVTYCCLAERALMRHLEGGCLVPIGVYTHYNEETETLLFKGIIVSPDGTQSVEDEICRKVSNKAEAEKAGIELGDILVAKGAKEILNNINFEKINHPGISAIPHHLSINDPSQPSTETLSIEEEKLG